VAGKKKFANGTFQYTFKRKGLLDKPLYVTFDSEVEGDAYAKRLDALLDRGIIPSEFEAKTRVMTLEALIREYEREAHPSDKDKSALGMVIEALGNTPLLALNAKWVDTWITSMKRNEKLAPATIRARVGALARCTDWGMRKSLLEMPDHAFRSLPEGYASYTAVDEKFAGVKREDAERDRRLEPGEYERILEVIKAGVLPRGQRPRVLEYQPAWLCLFVLAVESAMRLREMLTLTLDQVDLKRRTVFLDKTKNGDKRQVPLSTVAVSSLQRYLLVREIPEGHPNHALFPWWDGSTKAQDFTTLSSSVGKMFQNFRKNGIFNLAQCEDLRFHDLRHEATCRLYEKTQLTDLQIGKITGHKSMRMLARYANLRGSDLAASLW
jgi:integrase